MPNPYMNTYMPNGFENADQQSLNPVFQNIGAQQQFFNQQLGQGSQMAQPTSRGPSVAGLNPLAMAAMLRGASGNVPIPATDTAQMTGVAGMGGSMGTGLTQDSFNSGIGFNPSAQYGGYGLKY